MMVTQNSIKGFVRYVKWGNFWGAVPFDWNGDTKSGKYLRYTSSKWIRIKWWSYVAYAYFYFLYHVGRAGYEAKYGDIATIFKSCIYALGISIPVILINVVIFKTTSLEFIVNSCIHTFILLRKKYLKTAYQQRHPWAELMLSLGFIVTLTYPFPIGFGIFILPREQFYLTELIKPGHFTMLNFLPLAVLHVVYMFSSFSLCMFLAAVSLILSPNVTLFCTEISLNRSSYKSLNQTRRLESMMIVYRSLQIFVIEVNEIGSEMVLALQFVMKREIYICNVAIAVIGDQLHLLMRIGLGNFNVMMVIVWTATLFTLAMPYDTTKECLETWKHSIPHYWSLRDKLLLAKFRKSCYPIKVHIGKHSFVQKNKLMKFFYSISIGTMEALLTFKEAYNN